MMQYRSRSSADTSLWWVALVALGLLPASGRADDVLLMSGSQIEGRATRQGDKVVVELEAGRITLSAESVERIDVKQTSLERVEALEKKLRPRDVSGLLALADYCRANEMPSRERDALERVLEVAPDHAQARARLGYIRRDGRWLTRAEQRQAEGFVREGGTWLSAEQAAEAQRLREARQTDERAQRELEAQRAELEEQKRELEAESSRRAAEPSNDVYYAYGWAYLDFAAAVRRPWLLAANSGTSIRGRPRCTRLADRGCTRPPRSQLADHGRT